MPTVDDNKENWDGRYQWVNKGDEWSTAWGGPSMQWYGTILPRIQNFLPTDSILEIACGYGRWTQFLKDMCSNLTVIDISEDCIQACRQRFSEYNNIEYHVNDGKSLDMLPTASVDFIFCFDSLVHADESTMKAYLSQMNRVLKDEGSVFIHHSNLGAYYSNLRIQKFPKVERLLRQLMILEKNSHWRDLGVSAQIVEELSEEFGMKCISQEVVPWGTKRALIDCFSTIVKNTSSLVRVNRVLRNTKFMHEVRRLDQLSRLYSLD